MHFEHPHSKMFIPRLLTKTNVKCKMSCFPIISHHQTPWTRPCSHSIFFPITFRGRIVPTKGRAVIQPMLGRRVVRIVRLDLLKNKKTNKQNQPYSYRPSFFCKTPPADIILFGSVLNIKSYSPVICILKIRADNF